MNIQAPAKTSLFKPEIIKDMRDWLKDCYEDEYDQEEIDSCSERQIIAAVDREYDGGLMQFLRDCE